MTIACGDSHTSTHGALGAIAFGIGTSQVRDVLASQCLALDPLKVRRIDVNGRLRAGRLREGRHPDDHPPARRAGRRRLRLRVRRRDDRRDDDRRADDDLQHVDRRRRARRLRQPGRDDVRVPARAGRSRRRATRSTGPSRGGGRSRPTRTRATTIACVLDAASIEPTVTWGINPGQSVGIERMPIRAATRDAGSARVHGLRRAARASQGTKIDVAFIGSCTNGRLSDLEEAARIVRGHHVAPHVKALVVPGSQAVQRAAEARRAATRSSRDAGFEWRGAGCSMCLAMNPDRLEGRQICASSSNRNFKGRQGSPTGRTLLMSPAMVAAAAIAGEVVDVRDDAASEVPRMSIGQPNHHVVTGRALPLRGNDIDTDRIMPARFLRAVSFEGLETHVFEDDRAGRPRQHPFNDPRYTGASILVVNAQLRLRIVARARAAGAPALGHPGDRRRVVLGDLPRQLGAARPALLHGATRRDRSAAGRGRSRTRRPIHRRSRHERVTGPAARPYAPRCLRQRGRADELASGMARGCCSRTSTR